MCLLTLSPLVLPVHNVVVLQPVGVIQMAAPRTLLRALAAGCVLVVAVLAKPTGWLDPSRYGPETRRGPLKYKCPTCGKTATKQNTSDTNPICRGHGEMVRD